MTDKKASDGKAVAPGDADTPAKPQRTKEQERESFSFIFGYAKREGWSMTLGMIFLIGGQATDLVMPLFIGAAVDNL